jgi:hypothetical protein
LGDNHPPHDGELLRRFRHLEVFFTLQPGIGRLRLRASTAPPGRSRAELSER